MNKLIKTVFLAAFVFMANPASSISLDGELDPSMAPAPQGVLVKVDPVSKTIEVYRANTVSPGIVNRTASAEETIDAIQQSENPGNKIADYALSTHELDKESSTEAWYYRSYYGGWGWRGNYGYYRPYYYNWYRPFSYYPGHFTYGYGYRYGYGWSYPYRGYYYGWYYP